MSADVEQLLRAAFDEVAERAFPDVAMPPVGDNHHESVYVEHDVAPRRVRRLAVLAMAAVVLVAAFAISRSEPDESGVAGGPVVELGADWIWPVSGSEFADPVEVGRRFLTDVIGVADPTVRADADAAPEAPTWLTATTGSQGPNVRLLATPAPGGGWVIRQVGEPMNVDLSAGSLRFTAIDGVARGWVAARGSDGRTEVRDFDEDSARSGRVDVPVAMPVVSAIVVLIDELGDIVTVHGGHFGHPGATPSTVAEADSAECPGEAPSIRETVLALAWADSLGEDFEVERVRCVGQWALARLSFASDSVDDPLVLLSRAGDGWAVLDLGTNFGEPGDYSIPTDVWAELMAGENRSTVTVSGADDSGG